MKYFDKLGMRPGIVSDRRSNAALEFALVAPVLILLGLGAVEFSAAIRVNTSVDRTARTVAQLIAATPIPIGASQAQITSFMLQDDYLAGQDSSFSLSHSVSIAAASLVYNPGSNTPIYAATASGAGTATSPWDASMAPGITPAFVALPSSAVTAATGMGDTADTDSVIVVQVSATYSLPFLPNFGILGLGKISQGPFSTTATAYARPRASLIIKQVF
jgi:hypothetical protein